MRKPVVLLVLSLLFSAMVPTTQADAGVYQAFSNPTAGPGYDRLDTDSIYTEYQWGLLNAGTFQLVRTKRTFPVNNSFVGQIGESKKNTTPQIGPGNYDKTTIPAVSGVDINLSQAWQIYDQAPEKRSLIVAVIDTGIDYSHPNLQDSMWVNEDEIPGDGIDNDGNGYVDDIYGWNFYSDNPQVFTGIEDSHGTHGAGTIAASRNGFGISGIADNQYVKLMSLKALGTAQGVGTASSVVKAIRYAEANGASICNLSFGTSSYSEELYQTIKDSKMLFVVAAGNGDVFGNGYDIDSLPIYPASFDLDNIVSVANLLFDGSLSLSSNYGIQNVDLAAPGSYILSTTADGTYSYMSGTSMAAPMVTGVAALLYSYHTDWSLDQVKQALLQTARPLESLEGKIGSQGLVDAAAALTYSPQP